MNRNFRIGDRVVIQATDTVEEIYGRYELVGRLGEITFNARGGAYQDIEAVYKKMCIMG